MDPGWLDGIKGFQWDKANGPKIWDKHKVSPQEIEQAFLNRPLVIADDERHSQREARCSALGKTDSGRFLCLIFTLRGDQIRVISARNMSRRDRRVFEDAQEKEEEDSEIQD